MIETIHGVQFPETPVPWETACYCVKICVIWLCPSFLKSLAIYATKDRGCKVKKTTTQQRERGGRGGKVQSLICFRGGLEMLFSDQRQHKLVIPAHDKDSKPVTISYLFDYLCRHVMKDSRKELFVLDNHMYVLTLALLPRPYRGNATRRLRVSLLSFSFFLLHLHPPRRITGTTPGLTLKPFFLISSRPGILVLINDADWELEGEESYEIKSGDNILFVSTLHGG